MQAVRVALVRSGNPLEFTARRVLGLHGIATGSKVACKLNFIDSEILEPFTARKSMTIEINFDFSDPTWHPDILMGGTRNRVVIETGRQDVVLPVEITIPDGWMESLEILESWEIGVPVKPWRDRSDLEREWWLQACRWISPFGDRDYHGDLVVRLSPGDFDSLQAFHCLLGEQFFGDRGYIGSNLDGVNDILITIAVKFSSITVEMPDIVQLRQKLDSLEAGYFDNLMDVLEKRGCRVVTGATT